MMGIPTPAEIDWHPTRLLDLLRNRWLHANISTSAIPSRPGERGWRLGKFDKCRDFGASAVLRTYSLSILGYGFLHETDFKPSPICWKFFQRSFLFVFMKDKKTVGETQVKVKGVGWWKKFSYIVCV